MKLFATRYGGNIHHIFVCIVDGRPIVSASCQSLTDSFEVRVEFVCSAIRVGRFHSFRFLSQMVSSVFLGAVKGAYPFAPAMDLVANSRHGPAELSSAGQAPGTWVALPNVPDHDADSPVQRV
jgi:hypothetical protein